VVQKGAWIGSRAILYNCTIEEGAIVAAGAVVKSMRVPAHTVVDGNPAQPIAFHDGERWKLIKDGSDYDLSRLCIN